MKIEIWSDVVCPWCYIGKRYLERALASFPHAGEIDVEWKSFELDSNAPVERPGTYVERLSTKYRIPTDEAQARIERVVRAGASAGIDFRFEHARPGNTFDAHRLLHLARSLDVQNELEERFFLATFTEGHPIGRAETLVKLAADVGIGEARAHRVLDSDAYADAVRSDEAEAARLGLQAVPAFVFDRRHAVSGAQRPEVLLELLDRAWRESDPLVVDHGDGVCEGEACEV